MELHEIAQIIPGYTFRSAIKADEHGDTFVFQAKDIVQGAVFASTDSLTRIFHNAVGSAGRLQKNDVLLVARGMKAGSFRSTVFLADALNVVASSSVHIIRITKPNILPEYISHYLNSRKGQASLAEIVSGSYIGAISRSRLEKIKVPIPHFKQQKLLVDLFSNIREQQRILEQERRLKEEILNAAIKTLTTN